MSPNRHPRKAVSVSILTKSMSLFLSNTNGFTNPRANNSLTFKCVFFCSLVLFLHVFLIRVCVFPANIICPFFRLKFSWETSECNGEVCGFWVGLLVCYLLSLCPQKSYLHFSHLIQCLVHKVMRRCKIIHAKLQEYRLAQSKCSNNDRQA